MSVERISREQYETETVNVRRRGKNIDLLKSVVDSQDIAKIKCESHEKAKAKIPGLSMIRKKHNFQVRFTTVGDVLYIAPGVFIPRVGTPRKPKPENAGGSKASKASMGKK